VREEAAERDQPFGPRPVLMARDNDTMLVEACLQGDRSAFAQLVNRYEKPLFSAAYRITGSVDDAMDSTQNTFVKAYEKLHTFDTSYRFFSWIYRIAVNQALNLVSGRRGSTEIDTELPADSPNPEAAFDENENRRHLLRAMDRLAVNDRTILVLKHFQGLSYREIAEILELEEKTVKSRLFTARKRLHRALIDQGFSL
jgi:RNA polymerase sigma-70 factor (ECF subfamily)